METQPNYQQFDLEDFVSDANFIHWAQGKKDSGNNFWEQYLADNPQQKDIIIEAKALVGGLNFALPEIDDQFFDRLQERLNISMAETDIPEVAPHLEKAAPQSNYKLAIRVTIGIAASLLLLLTFLFYPRDITVENGFAGIREITLPDSSIVTLNANSKLSYAAHWDPLHRQVKLTGEGFFHIKHRTENGKVLPFTVAVSDLRLHVLGTSFNVANTADDVLVTLRSGRLKVTHNDQAVFMKPEEQLTYNLNQKKFELKKIEGEEYMDWTKLEFTFNDQPVEKVTQKLAAYYDLQFNFEDPAIKAALISGRLDLSNREETLHTLELLLNKKIGTTGKVVSVAR